MLPGDRDALERFGGFMRTAPVHVLIVAWGAYRNDAQDPATPPLTRSFAQARAELLAQIIGEKGITDEERDRRLIEITEDR